ncbi:50S ribosomal protein L24 [Candidatus Curtissbacteria bacterium]|nr:50S ribosomal protein L24 [Candidatus Curtissbacteria bacterium]
MYKFKIGDEVKIKTGRDKGKKGKIEKIYKGENTLLVGGVNMYKRHKKQTPMQKGGIFEIARPILASKVTIICSKCGKETKIGFLKEGKTKKRFCKKCKGILA